MTRTRGAWAPLCEGSQADECKRTALELARDLRGVSLGNPSVSGESGLAVLYHYADLAFPGLGFDGDREARLGKAADLVANQAFGPALFSGFTGAAWALEHIEPTGATTPPDEDPNLDVELALIEGLSAGPWDGDYDLILGLVGFAVYALERGPHPRARECLRLIVERLAELAQEDRGGIAWMAPGEPKDPGGFDLGVAHGVPGVIAVLAEICGIPELAARTRPLLDGAIGWLLEHRLAAGLGSAFAYSTSHLEPARTAWCYGDPGIAITLLAGARRTGNVAWEQAAIEIGVRSTERPVKDTLAEDPGFCHGTAGLAHIYNRLYQATGEAVFATAAREWLARTLELRKPGVGLSGYLSLVPRVPGGGQGFVWETDPGLLTGVAGIALVLLGASTAIEPAWDRALLCCVAAKITPPPT
jgi:hypothetical protein